MAYRWCTYVLCSLCGVVWEHKDELTKAEHIEIGMRCVCAHVHMCPVDGFNSVVCVRACECLKYRMRPDFGKLTTLSQVKYCSVSSIHSYTIKTQWLNTKRWPGLHFHTAFSWLCKTLRSQYRLCGTSGGYNRMAWTQIVSYTLASSSVVVCDWCGGLFGIWLQLEVPLSVIFLTGSLLPPPILYKRHS